MNERQRDLFLWQWSRRRQPGALVIGLRGAAIGAGGGLLFAAILFGGMRSDNGSVAASLDLLRQGGALLVAAIPAFAWIGWAGARRMYFSYESMFQAMLQAGARIPDHKPQLQAGDRGPMIAVAIAFALILGFIIFVALKYG